MHRQSSGQDDYEKTVNMWSPLPDLEKIYGGSCSGYLAFLRLMLYVNLILCIPAFVGYFVAVKDLNPTYKDFGIFFLGAYPHRALVAYKATSWALLFIFALCCIPLYKFMVGQKIDPDEEEDDRKTYQKPITYGQRRVRRLVSLILVAFMCAASGGIIYGIHKGMQRKNGKAVAVAVAVLVNGSQAVWRGMVKRLTIWEHHDTWTAHRAWDFGKLLTLKLVNIIVLYIVKRYVPMAKDLNNANQCTDREKCDCPLMDMGYQFFFLMVTDLVMGNFTECVIPVVKWRINRRLNRFRKVMLPDNDLKPIFDVADEYTELLARQFVVLLGTAVFPLITVLACLNLTFEMFIDRVRMVLICAKPGVKKARRIKPRLITIYLVIVFVLSAFGSFPNALVFISSGFGMGECGVFHPPAQL